MKTLREDYQAVRADHPVMRAEQALLWTRSIRKARGRKLPSIMGGTVTWQRGNIKVTAVVEQDPYPEYDSYGSFTDEAGRYMGDTWVRSIARKPGNVGYRDYKRFHPENPEYGQMDLARVEDFGHEWYMFCLVCTVFVQTMGQWVEIGQGCIGGVELDYAGETARTHIAEIFGDVRAEAFLEARKTLEDQRHQEPTESEPVAFLKALMGSTPDEATDLLTNCGEAVLDRFYTSYKGNTIKSWRDG